MKLNQLMESFHLQEIDRYDDLGLGEFANFYNDSGELSWQLTPQRIRQKMGRKGKVWVIKDPETGVIGATAAIKHIADDQDDIAEIGYLMINPEFRAEINPIKMFKEVLKATKRFDVTVATTNILNKDVNRLLSRIMDAEKVLTIKSPFGTGSKLNVWNVSKYSTLSAEEQNFIINRYYSDYIVQEM